MGVSEWDKMTRSPYSFRKSGISNGEERFTQCLDKLVNADLSSPLLYLKAGIYTYLGKAHFSDPDAIELLMNVFWDTKWAHLHFSL
tara:strand:+ start:1095 stop:1352 length:258 start_codon:yes stop_codon:yes gene_type:complete